MAVFCTEMFAVFRAPTTVRTVAVLLARFGSLVPDEMFTVSAIWVP